MLAEVQSWWSVVLLIVFIGLIAWVFWPRRKRKLEEHGQIPLRDDNPAEEC